MGNRPSKTLYQSLHSGVKSIWSRLRSIISIIQTAKPSSPDGTSKTDQNHNADAPRSEPQEERPHQCRSTAEDVSPGLEITPDSSSDSTSAKSTSESFCVDDFLEYCEYEGVRQLANERWIQHITLPQVTISAFTEVGRAESTISVPKQRFYTGRNPVIPSALADTPCATFGVQGVLDQLNATLSTAYTLDIPSLSSVLEDAIKRNYDFGTAYGRLRQMQFNSCVTLQDELIRLEEKDREVRRDALVDNIIINPELPPRRVWDLYSNRVVPWWSTGMHQDWQDRRNLWNWRHGHRDSWFPAVWPQPISHAWIDKADRVKMWTSINGKEWPVSIPKDADLDLIRIEMLNLGAEYTWLDVLCLRQEGGPREDLCVEEWKLDVPTIGYVYGNIQAQQKVVWYLSGLGRPLSLKAGDLDSDRCWFRRVWTLQETGWERIIAGDTPDGPMHAKPIDGDGNYEEEILTRFHKNLKSVESAWGVFPALAAMQKWVSTNPVDKVTGLSFRLLTGQIPAYYESQSLEDAWNALVDTMNTFNQYKLLFLYPEPGTAGKKWRPSWEQAMTRHLPKDDIPFTITIGGHDKGDVDWHCWVAYIERGFVQGLSVGGAEGVDRHGELTVEDSDGTKHTIKIIATHQYPIPEDTYVLLHDPLAWKDIKREPDEVQHWVVGQRQPQQSFEKLSVFKITDWDEIERLESLSVKEHVDIVLE